MPIAFLYLIASIGMLVLLYVGQSFLKMNVNLLFPIASIACLLLLLFALSGLNGNTFSETLKSSVLDRKDFFSMLDPYILGHIATYIMLLRQSSFLY